MKKILTICLLIATTFTVIAQEKPTKEETIAFINRTAALSIGEYLLSLIIIETKFNIDGFTFTSKSPSTYIDIRKTATYSGISWETFTLEGSAFREEASNPKLIGVYVGFTKKIKYEEIITDEKPKIDFRNHIYIPIPREKVESFKKALLRLSEIAKEENKDPFGN